FRQHCPDCARRARAKRAQRVSLEGRRALVTGGRIKIGHALAMKLLRDGAEVHLTTRFPRDAESRFAAQPDAESWSDRLHIHGLDFRSLDHVVQRIEGWRDAEPFDILVNNAATNPHFGPLLDAEDSLWQKTIEVNLMGNVWLTQSVVPVMRERGGGKIINIASINALRPGRMQGIYSITKAAVMSLTQTLAMELAEFNIKVNAVAPGLVQTKFARAIWDNEYLLEPILQRTPLKRMGQPEDIAGMVVYLASPASDFATGQIYVVDGGLTIPTL
ncbi:MAG: SDR family oxidoreductase, partial [Anaerolineae bacterium]|nr:SDR family oxidoreductase [Anaerolineae bacterium]